MKTVFIIYMPGYAGNFLGRLFSLGHTVMPLMNKQDLKQFLIMGAGVPSDWPKMSTYRFSTVFDQYGTWQKFHQDWTDFRNYSDYRMLNLLSDRRFDTVIYPIHPHELQRWYIQVPPEDFYYVDTDLGSWQSWWHKEQNRLQFVVRDNEWQQLATLKAVHDAKPIKLTDMLHSAHSFTQEYLRLCEQMQCKPDLSAALSLWEDWHKTRVTCYE